MAAKGAKTAKSRSGAKQKTGTVPPTLATGAETATGTAIAQQTKEIPKGAKRGSTVEIQGGEPQPTADGAKPTDAQKEPAKFTSNGQIPEGTVGSSSGPVPVSVVARNQDHADELLAEKEKQHQEFLQRRVTGKKLDEQTINRLHGPELRAIGQQRGYDINDTMGTRATRAAFAAAQGTDKNLKTKGKK